MFMFTHTEGFEPLEQGYPEANVRTYVRTVVYVTMHTGG
jgi:hypothetical protein